MKGFDAFQPVCQVADGQRIKIRTVPAQYRTVIPINHEGGTITARRLNERGLNVDIRQIPAVD